MKAKREPSGVWYGPEPARPVLAQRGRGYGTRGGWVYTLRFGCQRPVWSFLASVTNAASTGCSLASVAKRYGLTAEQARDAIVWCLLNPEKAGRL